jgi:glycerophosphoryl diester phosphodiesterase
MKFGKYIAHRGLHNIDIWAPENSAEAFRRAVEKGYAIELDVHLTKDNYVVVFHDDNLKRMTGIDKNITEMTMEELKKLRLQDTSERIPTLQEVLKIVNGRVPLLIELKNSTNKIGRLEKAVQYTMKNYKGDWAVQAFNPLRLKWFKNNMPNIPRGQLITEDNNLAKRIAFTPFVWKILSKPQFLAYDLKCMSMDKVMTAIANDCLLFTWTIRNYEMLAEAEKFSDSIIFENITP